MSFKDEIRAADGRTEGAATGASTSDHDDIARLLRALNEDLKSDPHPLSADSIGLDDEDEEVESARPGFPLAKVALALLAAGGVGIGVVMFDGSKSEPPVQTAAVATVAQADGSASPPLTLNPRPSAEQPEALISRASTSGPAPAAATPAPVPPIPAPPGRVEPAPVPPPVLPAAPSGTQTVVKPIEPPAIPKLDAAKPAPAPTPAKPVEKAPEIYKAPEVKVAETPAAPEPKAPAANTAELQAMLSPPAAPGAGSLGKLKVAPAPAAKAGPAAKAAPAAKAVPAAPAAARPPVSASGHWVVQAGSFSVVENAEAVQRKLAANGYSAQVIDWTDSAQRSWKVVRVGGYDALADARRVAGELKSGFGLSPMVVSGR